MNEEVIALENTRHLLQKQILDFMDLSRKVAAGIESIKDHSNVLSRLCEAFKELSAKTDPQPERNRLIKGLDNLTRSMPINDVSREKLEKNFISLKDEIRSLRMHIDCVTTELKETALQKDRTLDLKVIGQWKEKAPEELYSEEKNSWKIPYLNGKGISQHDLSRIFNLSEKFVQKSCRTKKKPLRKKRRSEG